MISEELFKALYGAVKPKFDFRWWPNFGTFEALVGAILVQNTKWSQVQKALDNLKNANALTLDSLLVFEVQNVAQLIKPSGFYNTKAKRLMGLCKAIKSEFDDFETFVNQVNRSWLLSQKGVGAESCDSILCYTCGRDEMVVDSYTLRILGYLDYEFESYDEAKEWLSEINFDEISNFCGVKSVNEMFSLYHGLIVEFCKAHLKGKEFDAFGAVVLNSLKN